MPCCPKEKWITLWAVIALAHTRPQVVFEKLVQVLVFSCAYRRIADEECSTSTLCRSRRDEWIEAGAMETLEELALESYDRFIGLELTDVAVEGCITKAPCGEARKQVKAR